MSPCIHTSIAHKLHSRAPTPTHIHTYIRPYTNTPNPHTHNNRPTRLWWHRDPTRRRRSPVARNEARTTCAYTCACTYTYINMYIDIHTYRRTYYTDTHVIHTHTHTHTHRMQSRVSTRSCSCTATSGVGCAVASPSTACRGSSTRSAACTPNADWKIRPRTRPGQPNPPRGLNLDLPSISTSPQPYLTSSQLTATTTGVLRRCCAHTPNSQKLSQKTPKQVPTYLSIVYIQTHPQTHINTLTHTQIHTRRRAHIHPHSHKFMYTYTHTPTPYTYTHARTHTPTRPCTHARARTHTHTHTHRPLESPFVGLRRNANGL